MPYVDITGWIENGMWSYSAVYPGATITQCPHPPEFPDDYAVHCQKFELGGQSGTYIETKAHVDPAATPVVDCPIEDFVMDAVVLRVPGKGPGEPIRLAELQDTGVTIPPDAAVIIATGWDRYWSEPQRFVEQSPYIERDAALWLFSHEIRCLSADIPRFDYVPAPCFPWDALWEKVPYVLAPVTNVFEGSFTRAKLFAFPLKIRGAMGTPVRAVLQVEE